MSDCCILPIPGRKGNGGDDGDNGTNGINAFTLTTAPFNVPAVLGSVDVSVENGSWASPNGGPIVGQAGHVQFAGYFYVLSISLDGLTMTLVNLGYDENALPGTVIPTGSKVSPAGVRGPSGAEVSGVLIAVNNLADVDDIPTALANLGIGTAGLEDKGNAPGEIPFVDDAAGLTNGESVWATANGLESKTAVDARTGLGLVKGIANTQIPPVNDAAGLVAGEMVFATASGLETKTAAEAKLVLGLGAPLFRAHRNGVISSFPASAGTPVVFKADVDTINGGFDPYATYDVTTWRWVPGAVGYYHLHGQIDWVRLTVVAFQLTIYIYKNGVAIAAKHYDLFDVTGTERPETMEIQVDDFAALTTDYYQLFAVHDNVSNQDFNGNALLSFFEGHRIG